MLFDIWHLVIGYLNGIVILLLIANFSKLLTKTFFFDLIIDIAFKKWLKLFENLFAKRRGARGVEWDGLACPPDIDRERWRKNR